MKKYTTLTHKCSGCGEEFLERDDAQDCCGEEESYLATACCGADVVSGTLTEYPLGGTTWGIDYEIPVCEKCGKEIAEYLDVVDGEWVLG